MNQSESVDNAPQVVKWPFLISCSCTCNLRAFAFHTSRMFMTLASHLVQMCMQLQFTRSLSSSAVKSEEAMTVWHLEARENDGNPFKA